MRSEPKASVPIEVDSVVRSGRANHEGWRKELEQLVAEVEEMRVKQGYAPSQELYEEDEEDGH